MSAEEPDIREYPEQFECSICNDLFVCPVTLLCQHTYCRDCIATYHKKQSQPGVDDDGFQVYVSKKDRNPKCPLCRCAIVIPPNDNAVLKDFIQNTYQEKYESRVEQLQKDRIKNDMKDAVKDELRKEMFNALLDETIETRSDGLINIQDQENDVVHEGITRYASPYVTIDTPPARWIDLFIKYFYRIVLIYVLVSCVPKVFSSTQNWVTKSGYIIYLFCMGYFLMK